MIVNSCVVLQTSEKVRIRIAEFFVHHRGNVAQRKKKGIELTSWEFQRTCQGDLLLRVWHVRCCVVEEREKAEIAKRDCVRWSGGLGGRCGVHGLAWPFMSCDCQLWCKQIECKPPLVTPNSVAYPQLLILSVAEITDHIRSTKCQHHATRNPRKHTLNNNANSYSKMSQRYFCLPALDYHVERAILTQFPESRTSVAKHEHVEPQLGKCYRCTFCVLYSLLPESPPPITTESLLA